MPLGDELGGRQREVCVGGTLREKCLCRVLERDLMVGGEGRKVPGDSSWSGGGRAL